MPRPGSLPCILLAGLAAGAGLWMVPARPVAADGPRRIAYEPFQDAETVVRATAGRARSVRVRPVDGGPLRPVDVTPFRVDKVLAGSSPPRVTVRTGKHGPYRPGTAYLLCLVPSAYEEVWSGACGGQASIRIEDGRCVMPEFYWIRDDLRPHFGDFSVEAVERAVRRFRGPTVTVRPLREAFGCDEPLGFAVTLTNSWPEPMTLGPDGDDGFPGRILLRLADAHGYSVLKERSIWSRQGPASKPPGERPHVKVTLAPGESVTRKVRFTVSLAEFRQDPERTRTAMVRVCGSGDCHGWQYARCPVQVRCPYRHWAGELARSAPAWAVRVESPYWNRDARWTVVHPHEVPVYVVLLRGWVHQPGRVRKGVSGSDWRPIGGDARATLAACFRVTRGGAPIDGPAPQPERVRALLDGLDPEAPRPVIQDINLARYFDFSEPGVYRIHLALPCDGGPSLSRLLRVYVLKSTAAE